MLIKNIKMNYLDIKTEFCTTSLSTHKFIVQCIERALCKSKSGAYIAKYVTYNLNSKISPHWSCIIGKNYSAKFNFIGVEFVRLTVHFVDCDNKSETYQVFLFKSA